MFMINRSVPILFWNVRGLGQSDRCSEVKRLLTAHKPSIACFQESKLSDISHFKKLSFLPAHLQSLVFLPSVGASGGLITAWSDSNFELVDHSLGSFLLTTRFHARASDLSFDITNVYGPCVGSLKPAFLDELASIAADIAGA